MPEPFAAPAIVTSRPFTLPDATEALAAELHLPAEWLQECVELLRLYNKSCSNALPQFESHQGGELL